MHDGIQLEQRGIASGVVVTEPFVGAARAMAALDGVPGYRFATVGHPTAELSGQRTEGSSPAFFLNRFLLLLLSS